MGWKGFNPSRKHTCTTGDLDQEAVEFSASTGVQKVQRSRSETSGDKNRFFRIVDLTSHTLLQACFCNFRDVSPLMSIYDLSHLECTVMGAGGQKPKMGFVREWGRIKQLSWVSHSLTVSLISLILEQTFAMLEGHQDGKNVALRGHFLQKENGVSPYLYRFYCCCLARKVTLSPISPFLSKDFFSTNLPELFFFFYIKILS